VSDDSSNEQKSGNTQRRRLARRLAPRSSGRRTIRLRGADHEHLLPPSCPARHPQRREVLVFPTAEDADREGYTACRRCHPATGSVAPADNSVKAALEYVTTHLDHAVTLQTLSQVAGLSPNHLQRTFRRTVGLSPKTFRDFLRLARLKEYLRRAESVASASYAAGYGSIRSLYEKAYKALGMTPAEYRSGGPRERLEYVTCAVTLRNTVVAIVPTDREHFACLFVDGHHNVTGAHIAAIGGQHCIAAVDVRVILRTALAACATAMIVGHYVPRHIMTVLLPPPFCSRTRVEQHSSRGKPSRMAT
jgi:methylphosphotriester-DNA--protein-cysteine methyltransferase